MVMWHKVVIVKTWRRKILRQLKVFCLFVVMGWWNLGFTSFGSVVKCK
jgi:hypothetical protein